MEDDQHHPKVPERIDIICFFCYHSGIYACLEVTMVLLRSSVLRISATFHLNTPLFAGGAEPMTADAELRPSEIKAALRFWWRAAKYSLYLQDKDKTAFTETEAMLFGSAKYGQGVLVTITDNKLVPDEEKTMFVHQPGARYLAYGLVDHHGNKTRTCLDANNTFSVRLIWRERNPPDTKDPHQVKLPHLSLADAQAHLIEAIQLFGLFGGLGSRSRRGFGSVTLTNLTINGVVEKQPTTLETYIEQLKKWQKEWSSVAAEQDMEAIEYSALTRHSEISLITRTQNLGVSDANSVLKAIGSAFVRYRSYGHNGNIQEVYGERGWLQSSENANQFFQDDHDFLRAPTESRHLKNNPVHLPDRTVFGLPHPYGKDGIIGGHQQRRASPLLVHVHYCAAEKTYIGVLLTMPAKFFPQAVEISGFQNARPRSIPSSEPWLVSPSVQWSVLSNFLRGLLPPAPITTKTKFLKPPFDPMQVTTI